jgi:hypothetical protein
VTVSSNGRLAYVSSLWSRRLTVVELPAISTSANGTPATGTPATVAARIAHTVDLPLAPRELALVRGDQRLIVADSFGGRLLVLDTSKPDGAPISLGLREFPGHNIRGLGVNQDGSMLVVAHQMLNEVAHTIRNDVHWGLLMSNDLRWLKLDRVLAGGGDLFSGGHMHPLGQAGSATADPAGFAFAPDGTVLSPSPASAKSPWDAKPISASTGFPPAFVQPPLPRPAIAAGHSLPTPLGTACRVWT